MKPSSVARIMTAFSFALLSLAAEAGPLGQNWTVTNSGDNYGGLASNVITIGTDTLSYAYSSPGWYGVPNQHYDFSTTAASTGVLNLDLTWNSYADWFMAYTNLYVYDNSGSTLIGGDTWWTDTPISINLNLTAGETWGFTMDAGNYDSSGSVGGTLTVAGVPEPATVALLGLGLFGLGFSRRKKA